MDQEKPRIDFEKEAISFASKNVPIDEEYGDFDEGNPSETADKAFAKRAGIPHAVFDWEGISFPALEA